MDASSASWLLIAFALFAANLPFLTERVFGVFVLKRGKPFWARLLELLALYFVVGAVGVALLAEELDAPAAAAMPLFEPVD